MISCQVRPATKHLDTNKTAESSLTIAAKQRGNIYACLSANIWDLDRFGAATQNFLLFLADVEDNFLQDKPLRVKPKAHGLVELVQGSMSAVHSWKYCDESFGFQRGGAFTSKAVSSSVLPSFLAANKVPRLSAA